MRILVVEDDRQLAQFVAKGLRESGCAVDVAYDGVDGAQRGTVSSIGTRGEKVELLVDGTAIGLSDVTAILE